MYVNTVALWKNSYGPMECTAVRFAKFRQINIGSLHVCLNACAFGVTMFENFLHHNADIV